MEDGTSALLFLYGLFWAEILATSARYKGFPTVTLCAEWKDADKRSRRLKRFFASVSILNLLPIAWLVVLYLWVVPKQSGFIAISIAAMASLSIFGITRLYHGLVASKESINRYYTKKEIDEWEIQGGDDLHPRWAHLLPGILYFAVYPILALALRCFL